MLKTYWNGYLGMQQYQYAIGVLVLVLAVLIGTGIGIGIVVFLFLIPFVLVFTTADFPTKKPLMGRDTDIPQSLTKGFRG